MRKETKHPTFELLFSNKAMSLDPLMEQMQPLPLVSEKCKFNFPEKSNNYTLFDHDVSSLQWKDLNQSSECN